MRKINYDEFIGQISNESLHLYTRRAAQEGGSLPLRKSCAPEEDAALLLPDRKRRQEALSGGIMERVGPRRYRLRG